MKEILILIKLTIFVFCLQTINATAQQYCQTDSVKIIPNQPTTKDTVKVIYYRHCIKSGCSLLSNINVISGCFISVYTTIDSGNFIGTCYSVDTIELGSNLLPCTYTVGILMEYTSLDTLGFNVVPTGIADNRKLDDIKILPNPFTDNLSILVEKQNFKQITFVVRNSLGQIITKIHDKNFSHQTINLSSLEKGIYFLEIFIDDERAIKKIVKN